MWSDDTKGLELDSSQRHSWMDKRKSTQSEAHRNRTSRTAMASPSLDVFKAQQDKLIWLNLLWAGVYTNWLQEIPSSLKCSVTLCSLKTLWGPISVTQMTIWTNFLKSQLSLDVFFCYQTRSKFDNGLTTNV